MAIEPAIAFPGISPRSYEHPADRAATSALHAIPLLDRLVKRFGRLGVETRYRQMLLGAAARLDLEPTPLFVTQQPMVNALTFGMRSPVIVVFSSLVADYEPDEVESV